MRSIPGAQAQAIATGECFLESLSLRFNNKPIDLTPPFNPRVGGPYIATLDWAMNSFSVDVRSKLGCDVDKAPNQAIPVAIGSTEQRTVFAKSNQSGKVQAYILKVTRLLGSETELRNLFIDGATLSPPFDKTIRTYNAVLDAGRDVAKVNYIQRDNGQRVQASASDQTNGSSWATGASGGAAPLRLLGRSGELQYNLHYKEFIVDVGFMRKITLVIESADPTQANIDRYEIQLNRTGCSVAKPFFDPTAKACVISCPTAYYRNERINRCSKCNTNCVVCSGLLTCDMCRSDSINNIYVLRQDGSCQAVPNKIFETYRWWSIGLAGLAVLVLLLLLGALCQCICGRRRNVVHSYESDSDSDTDLRDLGMHGRMGGGMKGVQRR